MLEYLEYIALSLFAIGAFADVMTTYMVLRAGGIELNPVVGRLIERLGILPGLLITKALPIAVVTGFYVNVPHPFIWVCTAIAGLGMAIVGWLNWRVWRGM
jgi:hypothetical protein